MIISIIAGVVLLIAVSLFYPIKRKNYLLDKERNVKAEFPVDSTEDSPVGFGYKCSWFAVRTGNQPLLAETVGLKNPVPANWESGIKNAYDNSVFITPAIDGWTLIVGITLPTGDSQQGLEYVKRRINGLSAVFGEAHYFSNFRIVEFYCWIRSINGTIERLYSYLGENIESIAVSGEPTEVEKGYNFIDTLSEDAQNEDYLDRDDLTYPDEELVMKIAGNWSIDPTTLDDRLNVKGLGLLGKM